MKKLIFLFTVAVLLFASSSIFASEIIINDTFNGPNINTNNWIIYGNVDIVKISKDAYLCADSGGYIKSKNVAAVGANRQLRVKFSDVRTTDWNTNGISMGLYSNDGSQYVKLDQTGYNGTTILKIKGANNTATYWLERASSTPVVKGPELRAAGLGHDWELLVESNRVLVYYDNKLKVELTNGQTLAAYPNGDEGTVDIPTCDLAVEFHGDEKGKDFWTSRIEFTKHAIELKTLVSGSSGATGALVSSPDYEKLITPVTGRNILVKIDIDSTKKKVLKKTLHGMNNGFIFLPYTATSEIYNKYAEPLQYNLIRWPGGSDSNAYRWKNGSYDKWFFGKILRSAYQAPKELQYIEDGKIKIKNQNLNTIDDFITFCKRYKKTPMIVANALKTPKSIVEMLKYFKDKGLRTPYVELGNELYYQGYKKWTGTSEKFSKKVKRICAAINKFDPNIIIILPVGGNHLGTASILGNPSQLSSKDIESPNLKRQFKWNEHFSKMDDFNGITVHHYATYYLNKSQANIIREAFYKKRDRRIAFQYLFAEASFAPLALTKFFRKYYPNKKMFLTEWGLSPLSSWKNIPKGFPWFQTWGHTLFTTEFLLQLLAMGDTWEGANYHILTGRVYELFSYGYIKKDGKTIWDERKMHKRMPYYGFEMIGKFLSKNTCIFETNVKNSPEQEGIFNWKGRKYPMLTAYAGGDSNGKIKSLFIINKDSQSANIQLEKMKTSKSATLVGLYCKKLGDNFGDAFRIKEGIITEKEFFRMNKSIDISKPLTIPPYFIGIINF